MYSSQYGFALGEGDWACPWNLIFNFESLVNLLTVVVKFVTQGNRLLSNSVGMPDPPPPGQTIDWCISITYFYILLILHALFTKYTLSFSQYNIGAFFSVPSSPTTKSLAADLLRNGLILTGKSIATPSPCWFKK